MIFVCYPKCTTCKRAQAFLDGKGVDYEIRNIKEDNPTFDELKTWFAASGLAIKKLFNTSGLVYKELGLKDKLPAMGEEECLRLMAADGMLVKRPVLIGKSFALFGFREEEWEAALTLDE